MSSFRNAFLFPPLGKRESVRLPLADEVFMRDGELFVRLFVIKKLSITTHFMQFLFV